MPHNLFLGTHLVKFRSTPHSNESIEIRPLVRQDTSQDFPSQLDESSQIPDSTASTISRTSNGDPTPLCRFSKIQVENTLRLMNIDSVMSLLVASFVNASILSVSAASFFGSVTEIASLQDAQRLLSQQLGYS